jgi:uncharacterized protein (TIGR02271 family)
MNQESAGLFPGRVEALPAGGWRIVVPLHAEQASAEKRAVVYEEVDIRRELVEDTTVVTQPVKHEELDVHGA